MIIAQRTAGLSYGTDPVAQSVRSVIAAPAARLGVHSHVQARSAASPSADMQRLYPGVFAEETGPSAFVRARRAAAFRVSVIGTAAVMMLALLRH